MSKPLFQPTLADLLDWCESRKLQYEEAYEKLGTQGSALKERDRREAVRFSECRRHLEFLYEMQKAKVT